jgi:integrase
LRNIPCHISGMRKKLTAKTIENLPEAQGRRYEIWDIALPSFGIRVSPAGRKTWFVTCRIEGRLRRHKIGTYPALSLHEARELALKFLGDVQRGKYNDASESTSTLGETVPEFIERYARPKNRGWQETRRILGKFTPLFGKPLGQIKRPDIVRILDDIIASGAPFRANRALAAIKKLFAWSLDRGMIEINPIAGLKPPTKERSRDRILTDEEISRFWNAAEKFGYPFGLLLKLLFLTAQRRGEVTNMRWSQIDFVRAVWVIPAENAKNGQAHDVPLSEMALQIIRALPRFIGSDFVFTTTGTSPVSGFGRLKRNLDVDMGSSGWRLHDLRRTAASGMARLGVAPHVIEKVLNHISGQISGVAAVYNRHGYETEKRQALNDWAKHVQGLCTYRAKMTDAWANLAQDLVRSSRSRSARWQGDAEGRLV